MEKRFLQINLLILLILSISAESNRPHILFIMADDLGWNDVGYHGSEISTPNIDRLAFDGVRLENYYMSPSCGPSRSQFLSGRYLINTGLQHANFFPCRPFGLPLRFPTLSEKLQNAGYTNHMIGKWHLGYHTPDYLPTRRGFNTFRGMLTGSSNHFTHMKSYSSKHSALDYYNNEQPYNKSHGDYSTYAFTRRAQTIIRATASTNDSMFMWLSYQSPHAPLQVPKKYEQRYWRIRNSNRRRYAGMVTAMDDGIGRVIDTLKETGLYNNTLIIFSTDNGGQAGLGASNFPLRGNKNTNYEGGLRGVGIVSGPLVLMKGAISRQLMHITDWMPTLLHVAGVETTNMTLDGINQWNSILWGMPTQREEILHNIDTRAMKKGQNLTGTRFDTRIPAAIRWKDWKLITGNPGYSGWVPKPSDKSYSEIAARVTNQYPPKGTAFLYNIAIDPSEQYNLLYVRLDISTMLLDRLADYQKTALPAIFPKNDRRCNPWKNGGVWGPYRPSQRRRSTTTVKPSTTSTAASTVKLQSTTVTSTKPRSSTTDTLTNLRTTDETVSLSTTETSTISTDTTIATAAASSQ